MLNQNHFKAVDGETNLFPIYHCSSDTKASHTSMSPLCVGKPCEVKWFPGGDNLARRSLISSDCCSLKETTKEKPWAGVGQLPMDNAAMFCR